MLWLAKYQSFTKYLVKIKVYESKNALSEEKKMSFSQEIGCAVSNIMSSPMSRAFLFGGGNRKC